MTPIAALLQDNEPKWYFQDPQGKIQGPLTSPEMLYWFNSGYFTMSLMIRRSCDEKFSQLGDFIKLWGCVPFLPGSGPPCMQVQTGNIDQQLRINIRSILPSISEEIVNSIIHALKYAGLETISDLPFVKDDDLVLILKPIQRRKLVKAWHEQFKEKRKYKGKSSDLNTILGDDQDVAPSSIDVSSHHSVINWADAVENEDLNVKDKGKEKETTSDLNTILRDDQDVAPSSVDVPSRHSVINWADAMENEDLNVGHVDGTSTDKEDHFSRDEPSTNDSPSAELSRNMSSLNCIKTKILIELRRKLLQTYVNHKSEVASSATEEEKVWENIAREMREKHSYGCSVSFCSFELSQLKLEYENLVKDGVKSENMVYLFDDAKQAFETLEYPDVPSSQVDEISKKMNKCITPHLKSEENRQSEHLETENSSQVDEISKKAGKYVPPRMRNGQNRQDKPVMPLKAETTGKRRGKEKSLDLNTILRDDQDVAPGFAVAPSHSGATNWADAMENEDLDDKYTLDYKKEEESVFSTTQKAAEGSAVDLNKVPAQAPFKAFVGNLPYDITDEDIVMFFQQLKVKNVTLPREKGDKGKLRGFGYVEFFNQQDLIEALTFNSEKLKERTIRVTVAEECADHVDRTLSDWRSDKRDQFSSDESSRNVISLANNSPPRNLSVKRCIWNRTRCLKLLQICADYKTSILHPDVEDQTVWKKIALGVRAKKFRPDELECRNKIEELRCTYERIKSEDVKQRRVAIFLDAARTVFETDSFSVEQSKGLLSCKKGKRAISFRQELLQVYTKYKAKFDSPDIEEQTVWKQIISEMRKKYDCGESLCRFELSQVKCQNEKLQKDVKNESFFDEAGEAVETSGKLDVPSSQVDEINKKIGKYVPPHMRNGQTMQVVSSANSSSSGSLSMEKRSWSKKRVLKLLKVCTIYKSHLLNPGVKDPSVWERIAVGVQKLDKKFKCDALDCRTKVEELKCQYERLKSKDIKDRNTAIILDESRKVFGTGNLSVKQSKNLLSCEKTTRTILFRQKLLEIYSKYKTEFANPDIEEQTVWQKIVTDMREIYDCGESLCHFELSQVKCEYENLRKEDLKKGRMYFYFDLAKEAFGSLENLDAPSSQLNEINTEVGQFLEVPSTQVNELNKKIGTYVPPHLRNEQNRQSEPVMPLKTKNKTFTIKVSNISEDIRPSDLQVLFEPYGTVVNIYTIKNLEDTSSERFAFIQFHSEEEASRAVLSVDGIEYNWREFDLKVEWADPSEVKGISE